MSYDPVITAIPAPAESARRAPWGALLLMVAAAFMDLLDGTIVQVALPSIQRNLHVSDAGLQWALAAYTLAFSLLLITGSRLGDIIGRKRTFLLGLAGFVTASALVAAAQTPDMLIGFRALQGGAAALMLPQVLTFIQAEFDPEPRRAAFALYGMMLALAGASGPLLGGVLIQANLAGWGWRTIFLVNVPIGLTALVLGSRRIPASGPRQGRRLDPAGTVLITLALLAVFYPLIEGRQLGWPAWSFACISASVPLLAAFAALEKRTHQPLIDFSLFRRRGPAIGLGIAMVFFGTTSFFFVLTLFLQLGLGYSALRTGVTFVPFSRHHRRIRRRRAARQEVRTVRGHGRGLADDTGHRQHDRHRRACNACLAPGTIAGGCRHRIRHRLRHARRHRAGPAARRPGRFTVRRGQHGHPARQRNRDRHHRRPVLRRTRAATGRSHLRARHQDRPVVSHSLLRRRGRGQPAAARPRRQP